MSKVEKLIINDLEIFNEELEAAEKHKRSIEIGYLLALTIAVLAIAMGNIIVFLTVFIPAVGFALWETNMMSKSIKKIEDKLDIFV